MTLPLPPNNDTVREEELPLRHRKSRADEAEQIRQEFVRSQKRQILVESDRTTKELNCDEK